MKELMEKIVSLSKRRGFVFPSSEIYGGFASCYDFGPLGVLMKNNIKKFWWQEMLKGHHNIFGLDSSILMSPQVWKASGHLTAGFADELVECRSCHKRFKIEETKNKKCPECGGKITKPKKFNLMMKTFVGPIEEDSAVTYLRAETCQGIYVNFKNILNTTRAKIPFGVAQIGKAFRNEITTKNFIFRTREFEQMEMQWFCQPKEAKKWFNFWLKERLKWLRKTGLKKDHLRIKKVPKKERAHYAKEQIDIEYKFPFGWQEIEGVHNRGDWDLKNHSQSSGEDFSYFDPEKKERYFPWIIETSIGVERLFLALLCEGYQEIKGGRTKTTKSAKEIEILLRLNKKIAPISVAVFPLLKNKPPLVKKAKEVYNLLKPHFYCLYDEADSIGRRYRRVDEIGCPFGITVDFESLKKEDVTVRERDTMKQKRVKIKDLVCYLKEKLNT